MWNRILLLLLVGAVVADHPHGWQQGKEYKYLIRSRTLTALDKLADQYTGIIVKALLTVQQQNDGNLRAKISDAQYAQIHTELPDGWESSIPDRKLELRAMPISEKPFEIKMKHGVVRDLIVDKSVPTWELNVLKSIVSQLQVDTQGENAKWRKTSQVPQDDKPYAVFKAMEDTVSGKCEVLYDLAPLPEQVIQAQPHLAPLSQLKGNGEYIEIVKTKNYKNCDQRMGYHYGITGQTKWEPGTNDNGDFLSKSSTSRIIISGNLKTFTIQSSVTTNKMFVSPEIGGDQPGMVISRMNLTLADVSEISQPIAAPANPESTGNLVYTYNKPFSHTEQRSAGQVTVSQDSRGESESKSMSSMSESDEENYAHDDSDSDSSSASSRSISSKEGQEFWQPKPQLDEAPDNPMLPYFVGYKGKSIRMSESINLVQEAKKIVEEIGNELQDPSNMPTAHTLEKFGILASLIRTMSRKQIAAIDGDLPAPSDETQGNSEKDYSQHYARAAFRDAVAQAGTGPAFLTIKDWVKSRKISGLEAADILAHIPEHVRTPTPEYINEFFSMLKWPEVQKQHYLNESALISFSNLVRQAQIDKRSLHNRYPVHSFGRMSSKKDTKVFQEYIPYLAEQLRNAVKNQDGPKIQIYSIALGNIAHPKILSVLEPYLEGKEQVTTFQRLVMVRSLSKLARLYPRTTRSVLFKLYVNSMDAHEIRCTAASMLMLTNPPLAMLMRMAEFTRFDSNKHVNSAVWSAIQSVVGLQRPEFRQLAHNARVARRFLKNEHYGYRFSKNIMLESVDPNTHQDYLLEVNYLGSQDSPMLKDIYVALDKSFDSFRAPATRFGFMLSSMKSLLYPRLERHGNRQQMKYSPEEIAKILGIQSDRLPRFEGNVFLDSQFFAFDDNTLQRITKLLASTGRNVQNGLSWSTRKFFSREITLAFPTETGLPFLYTLETPSVLASVGKVVIDETGRYSGKAKADVRATYGKSIQGRMGFITPFDHQHFVAGVDMNGQIKFPAKVELQMSGTEKGGEQRLQLRLRPRDEKKFRLAHVSVVPFTSKTDILKLSPVLLQEHTQVVHTGEPKTIDLAYPTDGPTTFEMSLKGDKRSLSPLMNWKDSFHGYALPWSKINYRYFTFDLFARSQMQDNDGFTFSVVVDQKNVQGPQSTTVKQGVQGQPPQVNDKEPDSQTRRQELMNQAAQGINSAKSHVLDVGMQVPGKSGSRYAFTLAWAHSPVDDKSRMLVYAHGHISDLEQQLEFCAGVERQRPRISRSNFEDAYKSDPTEKDDIQLRYGSECKSAPEVHVSVKKSRSEERRRYVSKSEEAQQCQQEMKEGNKMLKNCRRAGQEMSALDEAQIDVKFNQQAQLAKHLAEMTLDAAKRGAWPNVVVDPFNPKNTDPNRLQINVKYSPDLSTASVNVFPPYQNIHFPEINMADSKSGNLGVMHDGVITKLFMDQERRPTCALDSTKAMTFDGRTYPIKLGKCWHVAMTTYPREDPGQKGKILTIPDDERVSVIVRDVDGGKKQVEISLGNNEIKLMPSSGPKPEVYVNSQKIQVSSDQVYQHGQENQPDEPEFKIYAMPNGEAVLKSWKYGIQVTYDQQRVEIKASDDYRSSVRGLCGNYDDQPENDFTTPKNCMLKKPEEFAATFALTKQECSGPALENARKAQQSVCQKQTIRPSDVISDREAGRTSGEQGRTWGYHPHRSQDRNRCHAYRTRVVESPKEICFSTRPVPACAKGCSPVEAKTKNYDLHCMPRNSQSEEMKNRVEQGANPDFSHKTVSKSSAIEVPVNCKPTAG